MATIHAIVSLSYRYRPSFYAIYFDVQVLSIYYTIALKLQISQMKCKAGALVVRIEQRSMYYMVQFALNLLSNLEFICVSCSQFPESNSHEPSNEVFDIICYFLPLFAPAQFCPFPCFLMHLLQSSGQDTSDYYYYYYYYPGPTTC